MSKSDPTTYILNPTEPFEPSVVPPPKRAGVFDALATRIKLNYEEILRYFSWLVSHSRRKATKKQTAISPFTRNRDGHGASVPLLQTFRFVHEPIGTESSTRFIGRQSEMESLAERILFSEGGSFLVTGYRGVGKTSYVNQVIKKLEEALPWAEGFLGKTDLVDVYINMARPVQPSEIMHHIIRQLHDRLIEKGIYQLLDHSLQEALTLAYHRTSVNMARKMAESSEKSFGFNEASIGADWMKAAVKMSMSSKRSRTQNYEISYLGYDDKAAEHDIISIARRLVSGYLRPLTTWHRLRLLFTRTKSDRVRLKIIFVFDELDKLEEFTEAGTSDQKPVIDQILGALKNLFTTSGVTFVFVAGKDLQERWLEDVGRGDSVYESVFSYDRYLPCLWTDVDSICDTLVDESRPHGRQIYKEFKQFLGYKGRGIPRRIIRTFNEYVEWNGDQPVLAFTPQSLRRIRFFAGLQSVLQAHEKRLFGETHEEILGTQSDKRRLGVYYLIDWILRQGSSEFTRKNVLTASKRLSAKIALAEEIVPNVAEDILQIMIDGDYVQEIRNTLNRVLMGDPNEGPVVSERRYRLSPRRLVEFGGVGADSDVDPSIALPVDTIVTDRGKSITSIGKYRIIRTIGRGGMGIVYEANDDYSGRRVAIKMIFDEMTSDDMRSRFEREAMIMSELNHPNIVRLYDWAKDNERVYIVMEFLDGPTLEEVIKTHGRLSLELAVGIITPVVEAIAYVHQKGFVRNDIKTNNIKLTSTGRVCLIDFGITRPTRANPELLKKFQTMTGDIVGTPIFMAPEQFEEKTADERSDIYSLGVVLYNMLTGKLPFDLPTSIPELVRAHAEELPIPPSHHVTLPPAVDELILRCLEKDPEKRFQSMTELLGDLSKATRDLPPVDLKSVVNQIREEVRGVEAMDRMQTMAPASSFVLPMSTGIRSETGRSVRLVSSSPPEPDFDTLAGTPLMRSIEAPGSLAIPEGSTLFLSDTEPRITLLKGSPENVDFHLSTIGNGYRLEKKTTFGRSSGNIIVLRDTKVSRYHCQLGVNDKTWFVEDFNSHRGTFVNGERITRRILENGDTIVIGDFTFSFDGAPASE